MTNLFRRSLVLVPVMLCALTLSSCGDHVSFDSSETAVLKQDIYIVPEGVNSAVHLFYTPATETYLNVNENVRIQAVFSLDDKILDADVAASYYKNLLWIVGGKKYNIPSFRQAFLEPGEYDCILQTVNLFGDTLRNSTKIYVDTPSSISLTSPRNGYNQIDPLSDKEFFLKWNVAGVDPWETAHCTIYGSNNESEVWTNPIASTTCDDKVSVVGPLVPDEELLEQFGISLADTSITFYWGVVMTVSNHIGIQNMDTSSIFHFSTSLVHTDSSILNIPISYKHFHNQTSPDTRVTVVDVKGDTLSQFYSASKKTTESVKLAAQTGVTVYMEEVYYSEYKAKPFTVDIPEHAVINVDSVYFEDKVPPTVWPMATEFAINNPITFSILDKGSGISSSKIDVHYDEAETAVYAYSEPQLNVAIPHKKPMRVYIRVSDNAGNQSAPVFWNVTPKNNVLVLDGPYINKEDLE